MKVSPSHSVNAGVRSVIIPGGTEDSGMTFVGTPPVITYVDPDCAVKGEPEIGLYVHSLVLPQVEIVNIRDASHLVDLMNANIPRRRELILSPSQQYEDQSLNSTHKGALYKHVLPATSDLGLKLTGFPPVVASLDDSSPLKHRLLPEQTVEALLIPGEQRMDLQSGGFTAARVTKMLKDTSDIKGRQLVVKDAVLVPKEKGSNAAFVREDCAIM
mmetsp:Transcript_30313/g.50361  ORF Transcript_30313/g.50361 Transcript_30313/m.50361 type:complete len:215 (-) Transcript_30313:451-1095(-)